MTKGKKRQCQSDIAASFFPEYAPTLPSPSRMKDLSSDNFGLLIAYLIPGFVTLWGVRPLVKTVDTWLATTPESAPTVGGFLYVTLASFAAGLIVSAVRWAVIDHLYHATGIPQPAWDFRKFPANLEAFQSHVDDHYRYYQFYANALVALVFAYSTAFLTAGRLPGGAGWKDLAFLLIVVVLVFGSRDALKKYYSRTAALLPPRSERRAGAPTSGDALS